MWNVKNVKLKVRAVSSYPWLRDLHPIITPLAFPLNSREARRLGPRISEMVSQIALCNARSRPTGGCRLYNGLMCRWDTRTSVCLWDVVCAWHTVSRMGPKVVGILLEGEKYELAAETPPTACVHARSNREEASVRRRGEERVGQGKRARGRFACSQPSFRCAL